MINEMRNEINKFRNFINEQQEENVIKMVFGDDKTKFLRFSDDDYVNDFLLKNNNKVQLSSMGFAEEWEEYVDDNSYAYINDDKLYVIVYGIPNHFNKNKIIDYFKRDLYSYFKEGYGEFFVTDNYEPITMDVNHKGVNVVV